MSHLMHMGVVDYQQGKIDGKPTTCMGWLFFQDKVDVDQVRKEVVEKLVKKIFRFHALPLEKDGWSYWKDIGVDNLDMDYHFQHIQGFESEQEWDAWLAEEANKGLDFTKPWWRYVVVDKTPGGRAAVVSLIDHAFGDGASSVSSLLSMCENPGTNPVFSKKQDDKAEPSKMAAAKKVKARNLSPYELGVALWRGVSQPLSEGVFANDRPTKLKQPSGVFPKAWSFASTPRGDHLDVNKLKAIKSRIPGATVNDVMLALTALAIREYYISIEEPIMKSKQDIRGTLAINTRPLGVDYLSDTWFGNHIVIGTTRYPLHESRTQTVCSFRDESRLRKAGPDSLVREYLAKALTFLPRDRIVKIAADVSCKFSIMISNVCFSLVPLRLFGQEIDDVRFVAQTPLGLYVGAATYVDKVSFNAVASGDTKADPHKIVALMSSECDKLYKEVMEQDQDELIKMDKPLRMTLQIQAMWFLLLAMFLYYFLF